MRNLITDVPGLVVGNAHDERVMSGVTVLLADEPVVAACDPRGGGLGTRETDALAPAGTVTHVHGLALAGGSAFGLSAATGVQMHLAGRGIGFPVGPARVPIVPGAIIFDLLNGGDKTWAETPPYEQLARRACDAAAEDFAIGSAGAGFGATTVNLRGGLGSASARLPEGLVVGALAVVNPAGSVTIGDGPCFWAAPFERGDEFGGLGLPAHLPPGGLQPRIKGTAGASTITSVVAVSCTLDRAQALRVAIIAHTGLARAVYPVHTPLDGDIVFAVATARDPAPATVVDLARLGAAAADTLSRAVARAVFAAAPRPPGWTGPPAWSELHGSAGGATTGATS